LSGLLAFGSLLVFCPGLGSVGLRLAHEWREVSRVPRIRLLPGERNREFVLSRKQEAVYLEIAPKPLRDIATLILDTGLRLGEALALQWPDVHLEPANGARRGYSASETGSRALPGATYR